MQLPLLGVDVDADGFARGQRARARETERERERKVRSMGGVLERKGHESETAAKSRHQRVMGKSWLRPGRKARLGPLAIICCSRIASPPQLTLVQYSTVQYSMPLTNFHPSSRPPTLSLQPSRHLFCFLGIISTYFQIPPIRTFCRPHAAGSLFTLQPVCSHINPSVLTVFSPRLLRSWGTEDEFFTT